MTGQRYTNFKPFLNKSIICLSIYFLLPFISPLAAQEQENPDCSIPTNLKITRPDLGVEKIKVKIGLYLIDIKNIDDVSQSYTADMLFNVSWNDPRLSSNTLGKSLEDCILKLSDIWSPNVMAINRNRGEKLLDDIVRVDDKGNVIYRQRFVGDLASNLVFKDFPFDSQILHMILFVIGPDGEFTEFEVDEENTGAREIFSLEGWDVELIEPVITTEYVKSQNRHLARIDFKFKAERHKLYYLWKIIIPLCLIVLMAWGVFWIDPSQIGPQVGLSTATVFTLIAYRFSIGFSLPKISYFTRLDFFVFLSTILVFGALGVAIITSRIAFKGNQGLAIRIENWTRVLYLSIFGLIILITLIKY